MTTTAQTMTAVALDGLCDGFADSTHQAQQVFRRVLAAMAEPGTVHSLEPGNAPAPLSSAAYQICLALLDQETPLWLQPELASAAVVNSLRFHCGCGIAHRLDKAAFALITANGDCSLAAFNQGTFEYPDRSATVIVEVRGLDAERGENCGEERSELVLEGPGIRQQRRVRIDGFDAGWMQRLADNHALFPCGVDLILTCGNQLMALPRTTRATLIGQEH
ncbi:phosphonate C-P lyase system protein PhnH [Marinobacter sp. SS5-14b]|uniref:phosphonate C-P lyase system protein PhnH n=1 Tax=Marinobacter sp. SS5-14b TaxID=3050456 RepID=UPI0026E10B83|nr:phosphonate C-P lyase system protein PhnH [Marinobacter sp. SS5-14b]